MRAIGPVGTQGRPPSGGGGKKQVEGSNIPERQVFRPTLQSSGSGARNREWVRERRLNRGRGWAQQPKAQVGRAAASNQLLKAERREVQQFSGFSTAAENNVHAHIGGFIFSPKRI